MNNTHRLDKDTDLFKLAGSAFGTQRDSNVSGYLRLPITAPDGPLPTTSWLIQLELTGKNHGLLPFDIAGDVVIGRGSDGPDAPDLDLTALQAYENGVSRRHAMLRPTNNSLYLIDLGSTNGTTVNGLPTGKGAVALRRHDHLTIGQLNMRVINLERVPGTKEKPVDIAASAQPIIIQLDPPKNPIIPSSVLPTPEPATRKMQRSDFAILTLPPKMEVEVTAPLSQKIEVEVTLPQSTIEPLPEPPPQPTPQPTPNQP